MLAPIKLIVHKRPEVSQELNGVVRIYNEAELTIKELQRETGLSARHIASRLITQAAQNVEIVIEE